MQTASFEPWTAPNARFSPHDAKPAAWEDLGFGFSAMACNCEIRIAGLALDEARLLADSAIAEVRRIEAKYSRYRQHSLLSRINAAAGQGEPLAVDRETGELLNFAAQLHAASDGLFDLTSGVLRHAARLFVAQRRLKGPKLHVTLRKAFGFGSSIMAMNPFDKQTITLAFPAITLGAMPVASGAASAGLDPAARARAEAEQAGGAYHIADRLGYDDIIDPRDLRDALLRGLALTDSRVPAGPVLTGGITP